MTMSLTWEELIGSPAYGTVIESLQSKRAQLRASLLGSLELATESAPDTDAAVSDVDVIFQGGGMLGLAHLGALDAIEVLGLRPRKVAGTSAGSIVATLVYAHLVSKPPTTRLAPEIFEDMRSMPLSRMLDGPARVRRLFDMSHIHSTLGKFMVGMRAAPTVLRLIRNSYGIHPGSVFSSWLDDRLEKCGIHSLADLKPSGAHELKTVACSVPGGLKIVLPDALPYFAISLTDERPSLIARASMAIPIVFTPVQLPTAKVQWAAFVERENSTSFSREMRQQLSSVARVLLFDGGLFSNLPVDILPKAPGDTTPTLAVAMHTSSKKLLHVSLRRRGRSFFGFIGELFQSMRSLRDREAREAARASRGFSTLWIDTGDADWLDFSGDPQVALDLYLRGMKSVMESL